MVAVPPQFLSLAGPGTYSIHRHDHWEIKAVLNGGMGVREPGGVRQYAAPAFLLFPPRWQHAHTAGAEAAGAASWLVVAAGPDALDFSIQRGAHAVARHSLTEAQRRHVLDLLPGGAFDPFLQSVATSLRRGPARLAGAHAAATLRCLFHAVRLALASSRPPPLPRTTAEAVRCEMEARYYDPNLRVRDIARLLGLSQGELSRRYKRETGTTVRQALVRLRLERARALLRQGMRVKEVALVTGWSTQHHFSNTFPKRLGIWPSAVAARG